METTVKFDKANTIFITFDAGDRSPIETVELSRREALELLAQLANVINLSK